MSTDLLIRSYLGGSDKIPVNRTYNLYAIPDGLLSAGFFTFPSQSPKHGISLQTVPAKADQYAKLFTGGAAGTSATCTVQFVSQTSSFIAGTRNILRLPITIDGRAEILYAIYETPFTATGTTLATGMRDVLRAALDSATSLPLGGKLWCTNRDASASQIVTALTIHFGAIPNTAFDSVTNILTFTYIPGVEGNNYWISSEVVPTLPMPLTIVQDDGTPRVPGTLFLGAVTGFGESPGTATVDVKADNVRGTMFKTISDSNPSFKFNLIEVADQQLLAEVGGEATFIPTGSSSYRIPAARTNLKTWGLIAVVESIAVPGAYDQLVCYKGNFTGFSDLPYTRGQVPSLQCTFAPILSRRTDPYMIYIQNELFADIAA